MSSEKKKLLNGFLSSKSHKKAGADTLSRAKAILINEEEKSVKNKLDNQSVDHIEDKNIDQSDNKQAKKSVNKRSNKQKEKKDDQQDIKQPYEIPLLNKNEAIIYYSLLKLSKCFTTCKRMEEVLGISQHTIRKCLKRLKDKGVIDYNSKNIHGRYGLEIITYQTLVQIFDKEEVIKKLESVDPKKISLFSTLNDLL